MDTIYSLYSQGFEDGYNGFMPHSKEWFQFHHRLQDEDDYFRGYRDGDKARQSDENAEEALRNWKPMIDRTLA